MTYVYLDKPSNTNDAMKRRIINCIETFRCKSLYTETSIHGTADNTADKSHEIVKIRIILLFVSNL